MKKFKSFRSEISEAKAKASDYNATSEKSKFGGHRANVVHKTKGNTLYTGKVSFKTPKAAQGAADAYLSGYALGGEKSADKMMNAHIKNNKKNLVDPSILDEAANWIDGTKYQKEKKKKGFNKDDWEWNSSKQLYKKVEESVALDEQIRFKAGDMPNSELLTAIEKLKGLKAKAEGEKKKFDDPTLIDSVEQLIIGLEMGIKAGEKAEKQSSKFIAQAASVMNKEQKNDFLSFIKTETELFSPYSIFILKKRKFDDLCSSLFNWIGSCENIFDINKLEGHGQIRLFDYLAERYISYWIKKNTNFKVSPFLFFDPKLNNSLIIN
jgi:hypothetical protein